MGEMKRWTMKFNGGRSGMFVAEDGPWVAYEDYDTLRAEVERLREYKESMAAAIEEDRPEWKRLHDIEVAARDMLAKLDSEGYSGHYMRALAEACGRKG
jgi:hypothetical protein